MGRILGRDLRISDLTRSGFGIPYTKIDCLRKIMKFPNENMKVLDYLQYSWSTLENNLDNIIKESQLPK